MTKRYALRDDQWEQIKDLLPGRMGTVGVTAKDNRLFEPPRVCRRPTFLRECPDEKSKIHP